MMIFFLGIMILTMKEQSLNTFLTIFYSHYILTIIQVYIMMVKQLLKYL